MPSILTSSGEHTNGGAHADGNVHTDGGIHTDGYSRYGGYIQKVLSYGPFLYMPLNETSGAVARCMVNPLQNGTYSGVTLGNGTAPDGSPCPYFDGLNDYVDIFSSALVAAFDGEQGTMSIWAKVANAGVWLDGVLRFLFEINATVTAEYYSLRKHDANSQTRYCARPGGVFGAYIHNMSDTVWKLFSMTWKWNGVNTAVGCWLDDANVNNFNCAGQFTGTLNLAVVGAATLVPASVYHGWLAHAIIFDRVLAQAEFTALATA